MTVFNYKFSYGRHIFKVEVIKLEWSYDDIGDG